VCAGNGSNLFNGGGAQSYPMSFLHYLTTRRNLSSSDCYTKEQYLVFLSWTQYVALHSCLGLLPFLMKLRTKKG
jgi:hypothetical protein